jgi:tryptophan halogenase
VNPVKIPEANHLEEQRVKKVVIAGGGTAGWIAAAGLSKQLAPLLDITLVESDDIGTVGVGEATIPPMRSFHRLAGVDEQEFMRATQATFKLGILFENWGEQGDRYIHSFGRVGKGTWMGDFHHIWLQARARGLAGELGDYCCELRAAEEGKFATASGNTSINYAYHLDATLYARFLRLHSEARGVKRIEGKIAEVDQDPDTGFIRALKLESGQRVEGDLFIDCTGFRGLLIEQTLKTGYEDWSHWLPTDSALAVQTRSTGPAPPYTRSTARDAGWQWRIPLQHRVGNGLVYCSQYMSDDEARAQLLDNLEGETLTEPKLIRFRTGRRLKVWNKNCVALGLASGFLEPLESTSIHLIMIGVTRLMQLFPFNDSNDALADQYNELSRTDLEKIRDFIILHYKQTQRDDTPFWRHCRDMAIPDSLAHRLALFRNDAQAHQLAGELFPVDSWVQVMLGQRLEPCGWHKIGQLMSDDQMRQALGGLKSSVDKTVDGMPTHQEFIDQYCAAKAPD